MFEKKYVISLKEICNSILPITILILLQKAVATQSDGFRELCTSFITNDYKLYEYPDTTKPVNIYSQIEMFDLGEINEGNMDYLLQAFFTLYWKDQRLKFNHTIKGEQLLVDLPKECLPYFWQPDIFFETAKVVETFKNTAPAILLNLHSDGTISVSKRYQFRCSCRMKFHYYPFDSQICEFYVALIPPDSKAILHWVDEKGSPVTDTEAITILRAVEPLQYSLGKFEHRKFVDVLPDANYTTLIADIYLHRRLIGSVINTYIPSTLIVLMSWFGFWLDVDSVPARVALSITSLLTLCTQKQQYQSQLPPVNYIKAMDIWLFMCIFLVFSTLLEFAIANNINVKHKKKELEKKNHIFVQTGSKERNRLRKSPQQDHQNKIPKGRSRPSSEETLYSQMLPHLCTIWERLRAKWKDRSVDEICRILYPTGFVIFACSYWVYYLNIYYDLRYE